MADLKSNLYIILYSLIYYILYNIGVRGMPERDIESLGVMGKGAGGGQEILPPPPPSSPTESGCLRITKSFVF